jgi:hypothetical protein
MPNDSGKKAVLHKKHVARLQREKQQSRAILFTFIGILGAVALLLLYGYLDINYFQLQRPVAKVGGTEILVNQLQPRVRLQREQLLGQYNQYQQYQQLFGMDVQAQLTDLESQLNSPAVIGQAVLDQLINEQLIRLEAAKRGITISDAEMKEVEESAFGYFPNGSPTPSVTPTEVTLPEDPAEAFKIVTITPIPSATPKFTATAPATTGTPEATATLAPTLEPTAVATEGPTSTPEPTATPYTLEGYQTRFKETQDRMASVGLKEKDFLSFFEIQILEKKLTEELTANVPQTEQQVWARHILVADEAAAASVIERLNKGEDFATLAKELSTDTGSGANGGDLGWFGSGQMVAEFETAAFALKNPGDYTTTPVQSSFGFHIIQLIAKQERPLSADQYAAAKSKVFTDWLAAARDTYGVEIFDIWQQYVPTEPNFVSIATDVVRTATAAAKNATKTPKP